jgi:hypothetical protein
MKTQTQSFMKIKHFMHNSMIHTFHFHEIIQKVKLQESPGSAGGLPLGVRPTGRSPDHRRGGWVHLRTTNPIESTFATVRLRTDKTRGCVSSESILSLVFKLVQSAQKRWLRIRGFNRLAEVIEGVPFKDGIRADQKPNLTLSKDAA